MRRSIVRSLTILLLVLVTASIATVQIVPSAALNLQQSGLALTVAPNLSSYNPGHAVSITGILLNNGAPVPSASVSVQVTKPSATTLFVDMPVTNGAGQYSTSFTLPQSADLGTYTVYAAYSTASAQNTFQVFQQITTTFTSSTSSTSSLTTTTSSTSSTPPPPPPVTTTTSLTSSTTTTTATTGQCILDAPGNANACGQVSAGTFSGLTAVAVGSISIPPPAAAGTFPVGLFSFTVSGLSPSQTVTVTITLSSPLPAGTFSYWKFQGGAWVQFPSASLDSTRKIITLTFIVPAGSTSISDPGGPAIKSPPPPPVRTTTFTSSTPATTTIQATTTTQTTTTQVTMHSSTTTLTSSTTTSLASTNVEEGSTTEISTTVLPFPIHCVIATAAYGSEMAPEVVYMRYVRDNLIGSTPTGKTLRDAFNAFYYSWSPPVAATIAQSSDLQALFRILLLPIVAIVHATAWVFTTFGNTNFASVIAFGVAAVLCVGTYIALPVFAIRGAWKCIRLRQRLRFRQHT